MWVLGVTSEHDTLKIYVRNFINIQTEIGSKKRVFFLSLSLNIKIKKRKRKKKDMNKVISSSKINDQT